MYAGTTSAVCLGSLSNAGQMFSTSVKGLPGSLAGKALQTVTFLLDYGENALGLER